MTVLGAGRRLPRAVAARLRIALRLDDDRTLAGIDHHPGRLHRCRPHPARPRDLVVPGLSALTLRGIELVQGRGPACAARFGILLPPRGAAFAETVLGRPDPRPRRGQRRVVVGPLRGAHRGAGGAEVVQQPGPDGLGQFGIGGPPPPAADDDPPTVGGSRRGHARIVPSGALLRRRAASEP